LRTYIHSYINHSISSWKIVVDLPVTIFDIIQIHGKVILFNDIVAGPVHKTRFSNAG